MDNTELHYLTYDPEAIWAEMVKSYVAAGGDILYPGDEKEMLLRSVQADIVQVFAAVDNALRMHTLRYAVGEYLDLLGGKRCERIRASAATATVTITANATGETGTIPAGSMMTCDGEAFYQLTEDFALTGYEQTGSAEIEAAKTGSAGNALQAGAQMQLAVKNPAVNRIIVTVGATGGNEAEEDEAYRERIRLSGLTSVTTGPARQYEAAAKEVSSEIVDAKAARLSAGTVGVYLILTEDASSASIIQAVQDKLSAEDLRPLTDTVSVALVDDIEYTLNVQYSADGTAPVTTALAEAVAEYQEWQDSVIGRAFNPDRLMAALYRAGASRVVWGSGSEFDGSGNIEYTEIDGHSRCKGTVTLSVLSS